MRKHPELAVAPVPTRWQFELSPKKDQELDPIPQNDVLDRDMPLEMSKVVEVIEKLTAIGVPDSLFAPSGGKQNSGNVITTEEQDLQGYRDEHDPQSIVQAAAPSDLEAWLSWSEDTREISSSPSNLDSNSQGFPWHEKDFDSHADEIASVDNSVQPFKGKSSIWDSSIWGSSKKNKTAREDKAREKKEEKYHLEQEVKEAEEVAELSQDQLPSAYEKEDDSVSVDSSYAASVFSIASLASAATDLSQASGYSAVQIATATRELINIFQEDKFLVPLYQSAMLSTSIGPDRLLRNLRRLFKSYAKDLGEEAEERLDFLASRLVALRARDLAQSIVRKFQPEQSMSQNNTAHHEKSDDESSDEELGSSSVNDSHFDDTRIFREFLVRSTAFATLCTQIQSFVLSRSYEPATAEPRDSAQGPKVATCAPSTKGLEEVDSKTWRRWSSDVAQTVDAIFIHDTQLVCSLLTQLAFDAFSLVTDRAFIATGLLEPPLSPGFIRLRWDCGCGENIFSDIKELQKGGIRELAARMQDSTGVKVVPSSYNQRSGNQQYSIPVHLKWFRSTPTSSQTGRRKTTRLSSDQSSTTASTTTCAANQGSKPHKPMLHLMACVHDGRSGMILQQDRIEELFTDCALIQFLRTQYRKRRSRLRTILSLKRVQGIFFVKFHLPMGSSVIIRPHGVSCIPLDSISSSSATTMCECLPPKARVEPINTAEYQCYPVPPKTFPPVPPEYLRSLFTCHKEPHPMSTWIIQQLPKRKWGELFGQPDQPAEGWGIYYKEGWDPGMIAIFVFLLLLASLLFGILWTALRSDIQGAFGVASWIVAIGGALLAVIVTQVDNM
ncbi:uncharacterized protein EKO05_0000699 [Ascochyta rabiei]|uniref:uncharacterized protein n=1 Tax=Didymella rabiei TaxID=5454 RepID=UPI002203AF51|nr:uncharacterized protein EKO05_0000699 [Ascochyta rabiei]UPX10023.1 hypothetical protein EKO05_0000699 [Ascochyta rabiei]